MRNSGRRTDIKQSALFPAALCLLFPTFQIDNFIISIALALFSVILTFLSETFAWYHHCSHYWSDYGQLEATVQ